MTGSVLAIDVGGTKMAAALVEPGGRIAAYERIATPQPPHVDADGLVAHPADPDRQVPGPSGSAGVGVGCGGPTELASGAGLPLQHPGWRGSRCASGCSERFPGLPVRVHNDAVAVTVGEHWRGAGPGP